MSQSAKRAVAASLLPKTIVANATLIVKIDLCDPEKNDCKLNSNGNHNAAESFEQASGAPAEMRVKHEEIF